MIIESAVSEVALTLSVNCKDNAHLKILWLRKVTKAYAVLPGPGNFCFGNPTAIAFATRSL